MNVLSLMTLRYVYLILVNRVFRNEFKASAENLHWSLIFAFCIFNFSLFQSTSAQISEGTKSGCVLLVKRLRSSPGSNILHRSRCEILLLGTMVNETYQITKRHPKSSANVIHDCTAGLPTGREPYGNGNSIVVGGITSTHGGRENRPHTCTCAQVQVGRRELGTIAC